MELVNMFCVASVVQAGIFALGTWAGSHKLIDPTIQRVEKSVDTTVGTKKEIM